MFNLRRVMIKYFSQQSCIIIQTIAQQLNCLNSCIFFINVLPQLFFFLLQIHLQCVMAFNSPLISGDFQTSNNGRKLLSGFLPYRQLR